MQGQDEPVENFITDLYSLAEFCAYGSLKEEMIRDRLVVGIRNEKLSEKLQINASLTLESAVQQARQSESVKKQQAIIRASQIQGNIESLTATQVKARKKRTPGKPKQPSTCSGDGNKSGKSGKSCEMPQVFQTRSLREMLSGSKYREPYQ